MNDMVNNILIPTAQRTSSGTTSGTTSGISSGAGSPVINAQVSSSKPAESSEAKSSGTQTVNTAQQRQVSADAASQGNGDKRLEQVVEQLNDFVQQIQRDLNFQIDKESGRTVVTVLNTDTKEVIRQIPSEEVLSRINNISDVQGLLFKDQA